MATWHQMRSGLNPWSIAADRKGFILVSDAPNECISSLSFNFRLGAIQSFEGHVKHQPNKSHYLFENGILIKNHII